MANQLRVITERIDDVVLLLNVMMQIGLPELLNSHLERHWKQEGLDWGWLIVIWLAYILSEGDHRKVVVREWVNERSSMIAQVCGLQLRDTDFTDDRLAIVLSKLSEASQWQGIETQLNHQTIEIYRLPSDCVRLDATTVSSHHLLSEEGLFQFGHSKDDPSLPQLKTMVASLDPLGMPLATHVVSGEQADDGLYLPIFEDVGRSFKGQNLLWVGDCKMGAIATRTEIQSQQHYYLTPLARIGKVPELLEKGLAVATQEQWPQLKVSRLDKNDELKEIAMGYEFTREQEVEQANGAKLEWEERVLLVFSPAHARQQQRGLDQRLKTATEKLQALTPTPGRGKRQIRDLAQLQKKADEILKTQQVQGLLEYHYEFQPAKKRQKERYQIMTVLPIETALESAQRTFGWRVYVTNAPVERLSFAQAVLTIRDAWIQERGFARLKGKPLSAYPLFVQRDDQAKGLMHLLSLGLRILTLIEFVIQCRLKENDEKLLGLFPGNPKRSNTKTHCGENSTGF